MSNSATRPASAAALRVRLARSAEDLFAAQRLRYRVFVQEMGGDGPLVDHEQGLERDILDPIFDHLLLIDETRCAEAKDYVVGAYRLLPDSRIAQGGRFYCDDEFDLAPLRRSGRRLLELGRSCVDPAYRGGIGMLQMWQGLAEYVLRHDIEILFGAASFPGDDPSRWAHALSWLHQDYLAPQHLRVTARDPDSFVPLPPELIDRKQATLQTPALIRGYLRLGAFVGDGVFVDRAFKTTDLCIILDTSSLSVQARSLSRQASGPLR